MPGGIGESALSRLRRSPYFALRDVDCVCRDGTLTLRGCLPSYYLKQMAQTVVSDLDGVTAVVNLIEVMTPMPRQPVGHSEGLRSWP